MTRPSRIFWLPGGTLILSLLGALLLVQFGVGGASAQAASTVQTRTAGSLGTILADSGGKTLYMFDRDTAGVSNCNDACAGTWPPLVLASGNPVPPTGLSGTLAVITRTDGKRQVTYQDKPLYNYSGDAAAGDTKGDGIGGIWHVAKPLAAATASQPAAATAAAPAAAAPAAAATAAAAPSSAAQPAAAAPSSAARPAALTAAGTGGLIGAPSEHPFLALLLGIAALTMAAAGTALLISGQRGGGTK